MNGLRKRRGEAGFTMIELTVALLAGLIVAMGIVALSREATNTFHDEARSSAAEASLRAAIDRLRADLQRAGYMSTGNIQSDVFIATAPGHSNVNTTVAGIQRLQSIRLWSRGEQTLQLSTVNNVAPDAIDIGGNMTTSDQFDVAIIPQPTSAGGQLSGCVTIRLAPNAPAMFRLLAAGGGISGAGALQELANAFQPDPTAQFIVRLVDDSGRSQFLVTCGNPASTGIDPSGWPYVQVDATRTPLQTAQTTQTIGALNGLGSGRAWLNPVQIVRWEITSSTSNVAPEPAQFVAASVTSTGTDDPNKYDLMRTILDADMNPTAVREIVAEYVVDLRFAFNVDTGPAVQPGTPPSPLLVVYPFDEPGHSTANATVGALALGTPTAQPQRIRSVRLRMATRAAQPDRIAEIDPVPAYQDSYKYRYCVLPQGNACPAPPDNVARWARVRTLTTEVALPNQAKNFY
jgi:type II secretory pathway pseudopilin PulG